STGREESACRPPCGSTPAWRRTRSSSAFPAGGKCGLPPSGTRTWPRPGSPSVPSRKRWWVWVFRWGIPAAVGIRRGECGATPAPRSAKEEVGQVEFEHRPVLLQEVLTWLAPRSGGVYVDATVGGGGHAVQVAQRISPGGRLVGIDRDPAAVAAAAARLEAEAPRDVVWDVRHANFAELDVVLDGLGIGSIDGVLFDLGVSS